MDSSQNICRSLSDVAPSYGSVEGLYCHQNLARWAEHAETESLTWFAFGRNKLIASSKLKRKAIAKGRVSDSVDISAPFFLFLSSYLVLPHGLRRKVLHFFQLSPFHVVTYCNKKITAHFQGLYVFL